MGAHQPGHSQVIGGRPNVAMRRRLVFATVACAALSGCASFWDDITSRDFKFKDMFKAAPDPLWVIRNSNDGDKKSRALRALKEPAQNGGSREQQDVIVQILCQSAIGDPQPLCRMAAIDSLQRFKDPRAAQALIDAYYRAADFKRERPETMATIQCQALAALGVNANPIAVKTLALIANAPPEGGDDKNKQQDLDQRIAAARALAHFPQYQAAEALVTVLRTEQDVALRNRAAESLQEMTGEELPPDAQAWADFLHRSGNGEALTKKSSLSDKFIKLISFPSKEPQPSGNGAKSTP